MQPVSSKDPVRFTPPGHEKDERPPVYLLTAPNAWDKARWRRVCAEQGLVYPVDHALLEAAEAALRLVEVENLDELLELFARARHASESGEALEAADRAMMNALEPVLRKAPAYAYLQAARQEWLELAPYVAVQLFLAGVENVETPLRRHNKMVTREALADLPDGHLDAVANRMWSLLTVTPATRKNSASPSPSLETAEPSPAAIALSTERAGSSSASDTSETQG